jgi:hypothetical protein
VLAVHLKANPIVLLSVLVLAAETWKRQQSVPVCAFAFHVRQKIETDIQNRLPLLQILNLINYDLQQF